MDPQPVAFLGVTLVVIATPGPDTALTIRNTLWGGRRSGLGTALGVAVGQAVWTVAMSAGVVAILLASAPAFTALRLAGAAYLVWLGLQALRTAVGWGGAGRGVTDGGPRRGLGPAAAFRQGVLSNLGNPKMAVFFTSLLPQFVPGGDASLSALLSLGLLFCALTLVWLAGYSVLIARVGKALERPRIRRTLEGVMGAVLVALGVRLALGSR